MTNLLYAQLLLWLFYPLSFLLKEFKAFVGGMHTTRSALRMFATVLGCTFGMTTFCYNWMNSTQFYTSIVDDIGIATNLQYAAALYLSALSVGSLSVFLSRICTKTFCYLKFGDADFYLTEKRAKQLENIFLQQGYPVNARTIRSVVNFCVYNFRKSPDPQFGVHAYDWKRVIDAIIYDADLDSFLDQQELLKLKLAKVKQKCRALSKYASITEEERTLVWSFNRQTSSVPLNSPPRIVTEQDPLLPKDAAPNERVGTNYHPPFVGSRGRVLSGDIFLPRRTSFTQSCPVELPNYPLRQLTSDALNFASSSSEMPQDLKEKMLAVKVLSQFKGYGKASCKHRSPSENREILHHCSNYLHRQKVCLNESIFPTQLSPAATVESMPSSATPPSSPRLDV